MKIVFFGSDDLASFHLKKLIEAKYQIMACVTQPDRPKGRGLKMGISPIKTCARQHQIAVYQPKDINDKKFIDDLKKIESDLFIVIAYGKILPKELLAVPSVCCMNVHASLLPKYRGAAPINWVIIKGERETGISIIKMNAIMDGGDVIFQKKIAIDPLDTAVTLRVKLMELGANCLCEILPTLKDRLPKAITQDKQAVSYAPKMTKPLGHFSWDSPAKTIHNLVRGLVPWPSAYTHFDGKILKILETEIKENLSSQNPGEILDITREGFLVSTGKGALLIKKVHLESAKAMSARSFISGHKIHVGYRFS